MSEHFKEFDSLFRFYGSEIAAHSNYLVAYAFALAVFLYRLIDRLKEAPHILYDTALFIILLLFIATGIWFYGRLLYYTELSNTVHSFMGLSSHGRTHLADYRQLVQKELNANHGFADIIGESLFWRVSHCLLTKEVDNEAFKEVTRITPLSKWKAILITFSNSIWIYGRGYRNLLFRFLGFYRNS